MKCVVFSLIAGLLAAPLWADCPDGPDHSDQITQLLTDMRGAESEAQARIISDQLWALWTDAPNEAAQELLNGGMAARQSYDYIRALSKFDKLVDYCPDYAEGYNQRAFVNFLREDYEAALPDLNATLALNPTHIGAYSGLALTLFGMGRTAQATTVLREALELNPWLSERHLLQELPGEKL